VGPRGPSRSGPGLAVVPADAAVVLVHDGARPVASHALFRSVVDAVLAGVDVAVPVLPLVDTSPTGTA
jgi:2-C-methyl-D-erythritol 4-phosphate cytidylyltransferase